MSEKGLNPVADEQEVLATFTGIMRGQVLEESFRKVNGADERVMTPPKISEMCKAAELLGKHYGLFDRKEESRQDGEVTREIMALLAGMHDVSEGSP